MRPSVLQEVMTVTQVISESGYAMMQTHKKVLVMDKYPQNSSRPNVTAIHGAVKK